MTVETLSEDTIQSLAAQFDTLPAAIQSATGMYLPSEKSPAYYEGYANAVVMIARMLTDMQAAINTDVLMALAGKAAQLRQSLVNEEVDESWIDRIDAWLDASMRSEIAKAH
jgi:hypothetical protein